VTLEGAYSGYQMNCCRRITICFQRWNKMLSANWKPLCHDAWQHWRRTSNFREYRGSSHVVI